MEQTLYLRATRGRTPRMAPAPTCLSSVLLPLQVQKLQCPLRIPDTSHCNQQSWPPCPRARAQGVSRQEHRAWVLCEAVVPNSGRPLHKGRH